jgi:hypothetical protein
MRGLKTRVKRSYHWHLELSKSSQSLVTITQAESSLPLRCQKVPIIGTKNSRKFTSLPTPDSYLLWCGSESIYIFLLKEIFRLSSMLWKVWSAHRTNSDEQTLMLTKVAFSKPKNIPKPKTGSAVVPLDWRRSHIVVCSHTLIFVAEPKSCCLSSPVPFEWTRFSGRPSVKNRSIRGSVISFLREREREGESVCVCVLWPIWRRWGAQCYICLRGQRG